MDKLIQSQLVQPINSVSKGFVCMNKLKEFILEYLSEHDMSRRTLAEKMGVQHRTLNKYLNENKSPTLYFTLQLSRATGYDILTLIALAEPDSVHNASADAMLIAQRIDKLPELQRRIIIDLIRASLKSSEDINDKSEVSKSKQSKRKN